MTFDKMRLELTLFDLTKFDALHVRKMLLDQMQLGKIFSGPYILRPESVILMLYGNLLLDSMSLSRMSLDTISLSPI